MKALYKFHWDCGRQGDIDGLFVAEQDDIKAAIGKDIYFGEILGKHSEVYGTLDDGDLTEITTDPEVVGVFEKFKISCGYNPLNYLPEEEEE